MPVLSYLGYISRSRLAESFGNFMFNFLNSSPNFSSALSTFSVGVFKTSHIKWWWKSMGEEVRQILYGRK